MLNDPNTQHSNSSLLFIEMKNCGMIRMIRQFLSECMGCRAFGHQECWI